MQKAECPERPFYTTRESRIPTSRKVNVISDIIKIISKSGISRSLIYICLIMAVISSLFAVVPIQFIGLVFDILADTSENSPITSLMKGIPGTDKSTAVTISIALFLLSSIAAVIVRIIFCYTAEILCEKIILSIRRKLYRKLLRLRFEVYIKKPKGETIHTIMSDTQGLENIFSRPLYTMMSDIFDLLWISAFIIYTDISILIILLLTAPMLYLFSIKTARKQRETAEGIQEKDAELTAGIEQTLSGFETIKTLNAENLESDIFREKTRESFRIRKEAVKSLSMYFPIEGTVRAGGIAVILTYLVPRVLNGALHVGMLPVITDYANKFYSPVRNIAQYYQTIQRGLVSARRINSFFELEEEPEHGIKAYEKPEYIACPAAVENLTLSLDGKQVISGLNFTVKEGTIVLVRGESGRGKTTLLRALTGLYSVPDSTIYIYGRDIKSYSPGQLRCLVAYAGQHVFLHKSSILANTLYPGSTNASEAEKILTALRLDSEKIRTSAGENGAELSGGERTRVSLARAIVSGKPIIILDEVTAPLDEKATHETVSLLKECRSQGRTIIFATHCTNKKLIETADSIVNI